MFNHLKQLGLDNQWLIDQRIKYNLTFKQIGEIIGVSRRTVSKMCFSLGLEQITGTNIHSNDQLLSTLKQALQELGYLNKEFDFLGKLLFQ